MLTLRPAGGARRPRLSFVVASGLASTLAAAQPVDRAADALLAIDQQRASVVERIVATWGAALAQSSDYVSVDELRTRLMALRADRLFAATLTGTEQGLREVTGFVTTAPQRSATQTKALGDTAADVVYTPVTPCRLVETRGTFAAVYRGDGSVNHTAIPFVSNEIRTYTIQGANGVCLTQLPAGLNPSAVQVQVFGIPTTSASGDIEILPQGTAFGSTSTMVYIGTIAFNTASTTAKINTANKEISVQVRGGGAHLAIDVVGYFAAPSGNGGKFFEQGGNAFGTIATLGTIDNQPLTLQADGQPVMTFLPNTMSPNLVGGHPDNGANPSFPGQTIAGGGQSGDCIDPTNPAQTRSCGNQTAAGYATIAGGRVNVASNDAAVVSGGNFNTASGQYSSVIGGNGNTASGISSSVLGGVTNTASGFESVAAGEAAIAMHTKSFVWNGWNSGYATSFRSNAFQIHGESGLDIEYGTRRADGGGTSWVFIGNGFTDQAIATSTGAYLGTDGMWHDKSDRNRKTELLPVDPRDALERVAALPLSTWRYIDDTSGARHLGPMAQDFYASFRLGSDETTIGTIDESGVAFAAIQGLHRAMREKDARIATLEQEVQAQRRVADAHAHELLELRQTLQALLSRRTHDGADR